VGEDGEERLVTSGERVGVVLSGGGAFGAYEVGVLKALLSGASPATGYRPIDPGIYTGTSVGSYNAAVLCSRPGQPATAVVAELEALWLERIANTLCNCGNGVYRVRGAPFQLFDPGCLAQPVRSLVEFGQDAAALAAFGLIKGAEFVTSDAPLKSRFLSLIALEAFVSESPFKGLLADTIDLDRLRRSDKRLVVAASNWKRGIVQLYRNREIADVVGTDAILASAALPGIFPPVWIDGVPYVDGGVLLNTPLKPAIDDGATTIHVVFVDPRIENFALPLVPSTLDLVYRLLAVIWAQNVRKDALLAASISLTLDLFEHQAAESVSQPQARSFLQAGRQIYERLAAGGGYRKVNIHIYRPQTALGGGDELLDFQHAKLASTIAMGYHDTVNHDCKASECVQVGRLQP
jgi:predicted acylesterase/phospholipase RssA